MSLAILKSSIDSLDVIAQSSNGVLLSPTIGNQAIMDAIADKASQVSLNNLIGDVGLMKGTGFDTSVDSLKSISDRQFTGGTAV